MTNEKIIINQENWRRRQLVQKLHKFNKKGKEVNCRGILDSSNGRRKIS